MRGPTHWQVRLRGAIAVRKDPQRAAVSDRRAPRKYGQALNSIVEPLLGGQAAHGIPLLSGLGFNRYAKGPDMPFGIPRPIGAITIELRLGRRDDLGTGSACPLTMGVNVCTSAELHMNRLAILAAERFRTAVILRPFIAYHHDRISIGHFAMRKISVSIEQNDLWLEAERVFKPAESGLAVLVADRAGKSFGSVPLSHELSPFDST